MEPTTTATTPTQFRVIGAGLPRTGTASLKAALEILGLGPTYHMFEVFKSADRGIAWTKAFKNLNAGKPTDFGFLVKGYNSGVDAPVSDAYAELLEAYPDAKVILTYRPAEAWWKSVSNTIMKAATSKAYAFFVYLIPAVHHQRLLGVGILKTWEKQYGGLGPQVMTGRIEEVKRIVPAEKLLVYQVQEGWEPLCKFLDLPIPSVPFPQVNDTDALNAFFESKVKQGMRRWAYLFSGVVAMIAVGVSQRTPPWRYGYSPPVAKGVPADPQAPQPTATPTTPTQFRVIGAGLPRTGTASLKAALEILGLGPTYHMFEVFESSHRGIAWTKAIQDLRAGKNTQVQTQVAKLVEGYNSGVDAPVSDAYAELLAAYPNSKVILTHRPGDQWWKSVSNTIMKVLTRSYGFLIYLVPECWHQRELALEIFSMWEEKYGALGPQIMTQRTEEVKRVPSVQFLELPIPSVPFPQVNDKDAVNVFIGSKVKEGMRRWAYVLSGVVAAIAVGVSQRSRMEKLLS
ncbi:hypothetical protein MNV49_003774 [Pseudohyphozyma bogoriensis]|nr:hypothetical protein MNV49_003774 [Pseudohyphozyma bogoriensis]